MHITFFTHAQASGHAQMLYNVPQQEYHEETRLAVGDTTMVGPAFSDFPLPTELKPVGNPEIQLTTLKLQASEAKEGWIKAQIISMERKDVKYKGCKHCRRSIGFGSGQYRHDCNAWLIPHTVCLNSYSLQEPSSRGGRGSTILACRLCRRECGQQPWPGLRPALHMR